MNEIDLRNGNINGQSCNGMEILLNGTRRVISFFYNSNYFLEPTKEFPGGSWVCIVREKGKVVDYSTKSPIVLA